jgi:hypothetical protein
MESKTIEWELLLLSFGCVIVIGFFKLIEIEDTVEGYYTCTVGFFGTHQMDLIRQASLLLMEAL